MDSRRCTSSSSISFALSSSGCLVGHDNRESAQKASEIFHKKIIESKIFSQVTYIINDNQQKEIYQTYYQYRNKLLSKDHRASLIQHNQKNITQQAEQRLYSPMTALTGSQLTNDPLFTFQSFLEAQGSFNSELSIENNRLWGADNNRHYIFISAEITEDIYSLNLQSRFKQFYSNAKINTLKSIENTHFLTMGAIHHALAGTDSAKSEISTIGAGSLIGVLLLILITFKSLSPLLLSLISISSGIIIGLTSCLLIFNEIHIFTLVFGSSLIGVSIDYSFHYFSEQLDKSNSNTIINNILPGISMGMLTSVIAYLCLAIAPFPGLRQIAVFSATGIIAAFFSVLLIYPSLLKQRKTKEPAFLLRFSKSFLALWNKISRRTLHASFALLTITLATLISIYLETDDNIRNLQSKSRSITDEETLVKNIIPANGENQFFLVRGDSAEKVLELEETLYPLLDKLVLDNKLGHYQGIAIFSPSRKRQLENFNLIKTSLSESDAEFEQYLQKIGFNQSQSTQLVSKFIENESTLDVNSWLSTQYARPFKFHWLGKSEHDNEYSSIVSLYGIKDINSLAALHTPLNIKFVDYVGNISTLLGKYRDNATRLIFIAYILIFVLLIFRYSWYKSLLIITPPLIAALGALFIALLLDVKLQYFNLLAVILILGIGIDYTLFFAENRSKSEFTMLAIILSALTTIFSFGLLALSKTPVLHSFGLIVLIGIILSFVLSPIAGLRNNNNNT